MEPNTAVSHAQVNFFAKGPDYISDKFEMNLIDTSKANAFENFDFGAKTPDMIQEYVESDKVAAPETQEQKSGGGFFEAIVNFFASPQPEQK